MPPKKKKPDTPPAPPINQRDGAYEYAECVVNGEIPTCASVRRNCETFLDLWGAVESGLITDIRYNNRTLRRFYKFTPHIKHFEGLSALIGKPVKWELWQQYFFGNVYGWEIFDSEIGEWVWLHREVLLFCAKKQGKTFIAAGISLFDCGFTIDEGAKCFIFGVDSNTARLPFENCAKFVNNDRALSESFSRVGNRIYTNWDRSSFIQLIPKANKDNFDGLNVYSAVCEELHTFLDGGATYRLFQKGISARSNAHLISITTAGYDKYSFCKEQYDYYKELTRKGDFYSPQWGLIYELDDGDDYRNPDVWIKSNPNLGISKRRKHFTDALKTIELKPNELNSFLVKDLNIWTDNIAAWLDADALDKQFQQVDTSKLAGKRCYLGVDLARKRDLSAVVAVFPQQQGVETPTVVAKFFIDEGTCDRRQELSKVPFREWAQKGYIALTEGEEINFEEIQNYILDFAKTHNVETLYYDPAFAQMMMEQLKASGINTQEFRQNGHNYTDVINSAELAVQTGKIIFAENECLKWCIYNVEIQTFNDGRLMPYKRGDENKKIDGAVAWLMAYKGIITKTAEEKRDAQRAYLIAKGYTFDENGKPIPPKK